MVRFDFKKVGWRVRRWVSASVSRRLWTATACCSFPRDSLLSAAEHWERSSLAVPMPSGPQQGCIAESGSRLPQSMAFGGFGCR